MTKICLPSSWYWWVCTRFRNSWEARLRVESSKSWLRCRRRRFPASSDWHQTKNNICMNWIPPRYHKTGSQGFRSLVSRSRWIRLQLLFHELRGNCFLVCEHWRIWSSNIIPTKIHIKLEQNMFNLKTIQIISNRRRRRKGSQCTTYYKLQVSIDQGLQFPYLGFAND